MSAAEPAALRTIRGGRAGRLDGFELAYVVRRGMRRGDRWIADLTQPGRFPTVIRSTEPDTRLANH